MLYFKFICFRWGDFPFPLYHSVIIFHSLVGSKNACCIVGDKSLGKKSSREKGWPDVLAGWTGRWDWLQLVGIFCQGFFTVFYQDCELSNKAAECYLERVKSVKIFKKKLGRNYKKHKMWKTNLKVDIFHDFWLDGCHLHRKYFIQSGFCEWKIKTEDRTPLSQSSSPFAYFTFVYFI